MSDYYNYIKSLYLIFVITWFAGLFYIPRLFIYHIEADQRPSPEKEILTHQLKLMSKRLWFIITWPSAILATLFAIWLLIIFPAWLQQPWMHIKLAFVVLLIAYHLKSHQIFVSCGSGGSSPVPGNGGGQFPQGGGGGSSGSGSSKGDGVKIPTVIDNRLFLEKIDVDDSVDPCVARIINMLASKDMQNLTVPDIGQLSGTGHLSQGILDLFDKSGNYDLVFKVADTGRDSNGNPRNATTVGSSDGRGNFTFTITIDDDYVKNATQLAIARTIIHESVHAYLGHVLQNNFLSDTAQLLREYKDRFGNQNITEHTFMTQYAEAIGYSLSVWAGDIHNQEYYQNLAWSGGLLETEAYKKLSSSKKLVIQNANIAEGNAINKATSNARGTKCK